MWCFCGIGLWLVHTPQCSALAFLHRPCEFETDISTSWPITGKHSITDKGYLRFNKMHASQSGFDSQSYCCCWQNKNTSVYQKIMEGWRRLQNTPAQYLRIFRQIIHLLQCLYQFCLVVKNTSNSFKGPGDTNLNEMLHRYEQNKSRKIRWTNRGLKKNILPHNWSTKKT